MAEKEIVLGDYTATSSGRRGANSSGYYDIFEVYHHIELVAVVNFSDGMALDGIYSNDTDLITMLLLKYQPGPGFTIFPKFEVYPY